MEIEAEIFRWGPSKTKAVDVDVDVNADVKTLKLHQAIKALNKKPNLRVAIVVNSLNRTSMVYNQSMKMMVSKNNYYEKFRSIFSTSSVINYIAVSRESLSILMLMSGSE